MAYSNFNTIFEFPEQYASGCLFHFPKSDDSFEITKHTQFWFACLRCSSSLRTAESVAVEGVKLTPCHQKSHTHRQGVMFYFFLFVFSSSSSFFFFNLFYFLVFLNHTFSNQDSSENFKNIENMFLQTEKGVPDVVNFTLLLLV